MEAGHFKMPGIRQGPVEAAQRGVAGKRLWTGRQEQPRWSQSVAQQLEEAGDPVGGDAASSAGSRAGSWGGGWGLGSGGEGRGGNKAPEIVRGTARKLLVLGPQGGWSSFLHGGVVPRQPA